MTAGIETGIDRGVLYLREGGAVPWNGLISVAETKSSREVKSYYLDGVKYLDHHVPGSYAASLSAFTYPDELESSARELRSMPRGYFCMINRQKASIWPIGPGW